MKGLWYSGKIIIVGINCPRSIVGVNAKLIGGITCIIIDGFADSIMLCVKVTLDIPMPGRGDHFAVRTVPSLSAHTNGIPPTMPKSQRELLLSYSSNSHCQRLKFPPSPYNIY